jgi:MoaA/NifB/PqqE/SkfB family radical SAM enzyme
MMPDLETGARLFQDMTRQIKTAIAFKRMPSAAGVIKTFLMHNCIQPFVKKPLLPRALCFYVTKRCNMRCMMCGIWKENGSELYKKEMSLKSIGSVFSDPLFSKLQYLNINGGEPTLRNDLPDIVALLTEKVPRIKTVTMNSNGQIPHRTVRFVRQIAQVCKKRNMRFSLSISLHGTETLNDSITGVKGSYQSAMSTLHSLKRIQKENRFYVAVNCVLTKQNVAHAHEMLKWSKKTSIPINFTLGEVRERFNNIDIKESILINGSEKQHLIKFISELSHNMPFLNQHKFRYHVISDMLNIDKSRIISCHYAMAGAILGHDGTLYYCKKSKGLDSCYSKSAYNIYYNPINVKYRKEEIIEILCQDCVPNTFIQQELEKDLMKYLSFVLRSLIFKRRADASQ